MDGWTVDLVDRWLAIVVLWVFCEEFRNLMSKDWSMIVVKYTGEAIGCLLQSSDQHSMAT